MSFTCHTNFGPSFGHSFSNPVSLEMPLRSGPRHCGQSSAQTLKEIKARRGTRHRVCICFPFRFEDEPEWTFIGERQARFRQMLSLTDAPRYIACTAPKARNGSEIGAQFQTFSLLTQCHAFEHCFAI